MKRSRCKALGLPGDALDCEIPGLAETSDSQKKPLASRGLTVFGAGNQVRTGGLYLGEVAKTTVIILRRCRSLRSIHDRVELDTVSLLIRLLAMILLIVALGARANKRRYSDFLPID